MKRVVAILLAALAMSGCASIPEHSEVRPVKQVGESNATVAVTPPRRDLNPFDLVRNFVNSAAAPQSDHAAARLHLTPVAARYWTPPPDLLIVDDVDTIPVPQPTPSAEGVQMVGLQADKVGRLLPDQSFAPEKGKYEIQLRVERQRDGQWRIATPPPELVVTTASFTSNYRPVPIYFLDHSRTGVVPDLRYVVSQPASTLPRHVIDLLLSGPSLGFRQAMGTAIPAGVHTKTNASESSDGALEINLSDLGNVSLETRRLIAAQVVLSLQSVSSARVRLREEGMQLLPDALDLRPADVASYEASNSPRADLPGLVIVDERLVTLDAKANPVPGPAGSGEYQIVRAAESPDGARLAAVVRQPSGGVNLRIGRYGQALLPLAVSGAYMSKPSWRGTRELWTVVNSHDVMRLVDDGNGSWSVLPVNATALTGGQPITDLRLSRDGTRIAAVVDGKLVVAGVIDQPGGVVFTQPRVLGAGGDGSRITGLEWRNTKALVAITDSNTDPVWEVSVDGFQWTKYASANLGQPLTAVTVAPGGRVIVADRSGLWQAEDADDLWTLLQVPIGGGSIPLYPG